MPELPMPRVSASAVPTGRYEAPGTVPLQDQRAEQLQQLGRAMTVAGAQAMDVGEAQRFDYIAAQAREADALFSDQVRQLDSQYMGLVGKAAIDGRQAADKALEEQRQKIGGGLQDELARDVFEAAAERRRQSALSRWDGHQRQQTRAYEVGQAEASSKAAVEDYQRYVHTDPEAAARHRDLALANSDTVAERMGASPAVRDAMRLETTTAMHAGVIDDLITQNDPGKARSYLQANQGEMTRQTAARAQQVVDRAALAHDARIVAEQAFVQAERERRNDYLASGELPLGMTPDAFVADIQLDAADREWISQRVFSVVDEDGTLSPELKAEATARLSFIGRRRAQVAAGQVDVAMTQAEAWLSQNPLAGVSEMPPQLYVQAQRAGRLPQLAEFARSGRYVTDSRAYEELRALPADRLAAMTDVEFRAEFRGRLDNHDFAYGQALLKRARGGASGSDFEVITRQQRVEQSAIGLGIIPDPAAPGSRSADQNAAFYRYRLEVQQRLDALQATQPDKELGTKDLQGVLDEIAMDKVRVDTAAWWDPEKVFIQVDPADQENAYVMIGEQQVFLRDVPPDQRQEITRTLRARRQTVSQQRIAEMWLRAGRPGAPPERR